LLPNTVVIIYIYDYSHYIRKPALTRGITAHECGGAQFVEAPGQMPTFPSRKSSSVHRTTTVGPANRTLHQKMLLRHSDESATAH